MFKEDKFNNFIKEMDNALTERNNVYGDSWKHQDISFLENRLLAKVNEYKLTKHHKKLISLSNLAMMLYVRCDEK